MMMSMRLPRALAALALFGSMFCAVHGMASKSGATQTKSKPVERREGDEDSEKLVLQHTSKIFHSFLNIMNDPNNEENLKQNFSNMAGNFVSFIFDANKRGEVRSLADEQEVKQYMYRKLSGIFETVKRRRTQVRN